MDRPLDELRHEHRLIERSLAAMESIVAKLRDGEHISPDVLSDGLTFVRGFADGCHHAKEEQGLFPILASKGAMVEGGPVKVLSADHEAGRKLMRDLERALDLLRAGQEADGRAAAHRALSLYTKMLRRHIAREDEIVFPLAESLITPEEQERLAEHFERVEERSGEGAHERYEALVQSMELAVGIGATA